MPNKLPRKVVTFKTTLDQSKDVTPGQNMANNEIQVLWLGKQIDRFTLTELGDTECSWDLECPGIGFFDLELVFLTDNARHCRIKHSFVSNDRGINWHYFQANSRDNRGNRRMSIMVDDGLDQRSKIFWENGIYNELTQPSVVKIWIEVPPTIAWDESYGALDWNNWVNQKRRDRYPPELPGAELQTPSEDYYEILAAIDKEKLRSQNYYTSD
jgi:hypothetical protein